MTTTTFTLPCPDTMLPSMADLTNIFIKIAKLPSDLIVLAGKYALKFGEGVIKQFVDQAENIKKVLDAIVKTLSKIIPDIPDPLFPDLSWPDFEWEKRIQALIQNFHMFLQKSILKIIDAILPINFTINIMGLAIDVLKLLTNPADALKALAESIGKQLDKFFNLLPDAYKWFCGLVDIDSASLKLRVILDYIMAKLNGGLLGLMFDAFGGLIKKFKSIWNALKLPKIPDFIDLNIENILANIIKGALDAAKATVDKLANTIGDAVDAAQQIAQATFNAILKAKEKIIKAFEALSFSLPGLGSFDVFSMIGGVIEDIVDCLEKKIYRMIQAFRDFSFNGPKIVLMKWIEKITKFLKAIGLGALTEWLTFSFCKFLKLIGFPTSISIPTANLDPTALPA